VCALPAAKEAQSPALAPTTMARGTERCRTDRAVAIQVQFEKQILETSFSLYRLQGLGETRRFQKR
jgi:hypothetical protein